MQTIGDQPVLPGDRIRKAVVILNYSDHKGKARKLYDNFAAPILNLAGIQQTVYSTNELSKLREYVEHMEDADAVIFAEETRPFSNVYSPSSSWTGPL